LPKVAPQTSKPLALGGGQPVVATALVQIRLLEPITDDLRGGLEFPGQFLRTATGSDELHDLLPVFRRVRWTRSRHRGLLLTSIHVTGSTPDIGILRGSHKEDTEPGEEMTTS